MSDRLSGLDVAGRVVFVRSDLNVPLAHDGERVVISDDGRIRASLPTIQSLRARGARVVVVAHLGRPRGEADPALSLAPVAERLGELLGTPVRFIPSVTGETVSAAVASLGDGDVALLE
ncbi:MAG: hypothetical protein RL347_1912, partial [Actinomycetota bacterium]